LLTLWEGREEGKEEELRGRRKKKAPLAAGEFGVLRQEKRKGGGEGRGGREKKKKRERLRLEILPIKSGGRGGMKTAQKRERGKKSR